MTAAGVGGGRHGTDSLALQAGATGHSPSSLLAQASHLLRVPVRYVNELAWPLIRPSCSNVIIPSIATGVPASVDLSVYGIWILREVA